MKLIYSDSSSCDLSDSDNDKCFVCDEYGNLMICDICDNSCHVKCAYPVIDDVPEGEWHCHECLTELGLLNTH